MISVEEAKKFVIENSPVFGEEKMAVSEAIGRVISQNILAPISLPSFRQSAMDGYCIMKSDFENGIKEFQLAGEIPAGSKQKIALKKGECYRIYTGAPVPDNATAVIMQENVLAQESKIIIRQEGIKEQENIRQIGEDISEGKIAVEQYHIVNPATVGFLNSLGIIEVEVYKKPKIAIVVTGNELIEPGKELPFGGVYESNGQMLKAALSQLNIKAEVFKLKDDYKSTLELISQLTNQYELILFSGGISVGDYDFVGKALNELNSTTIFYKVNQKPGKPLYFGRLEGSFVFGLPGNPSSSLVCFYEYVLPWINNSQKKCPSFFLQKNLSLTHDFTVKPGRAQFLKARVFEDKVTILEGQNSFMLKSFTYANALVYLNGEKVSFKSSDNVEVHILP